MKKIFSLLLGILMVAGCLFMSVDQVKAEDGNVSDVVISIDGKTFSSIKAGDEFIIGDKSINDVEVKIISVNGHELTNVGTKSGVLDSQGRTVLEFSNNETGKGIWNVRIFYHAGDDPVKENQPYEFEITGLIFKCSENAVEETPTLKKLSSVKLTGAKNSATVSWKGLASDADGVKFQYSLDKSFAKKNTVTVSKKNTKTTIKKLKAGKTYYVRVCAYKKGTDALGNKITIQSKWVTKNVKIK